MTGDRPAPQKQEVSREFAFHVEMRTRDLIEAGLTPEAARQRAEVECARPPAVEQSCVTLAKKRDRRRLWADLAGGAAQDARHAFRRLRRRPVGLVAVAAMALGIAAATAIYSVVDGVLLRPLPFADPDRLVSIWLTDEAWRADPVLASQWDRVAIGRVEYDPLVGRTPALEHVALWTESSAMIADASGQVARVATVRATASLLPLLGVTPARGRVFAAGEDVLNGPAIAMLSWDAWRTRFNGDEAMIGRPLLIDDVPHEVVGVLPPGLRMSRGGPPPAVWVPALQQTYDLPQQRNRSYRSLGRLAHGSTVAEAELQVAAVFRSTSSGGLGARVESWQADDTRGVRPSIVMLAGAVALLLVIACVNVTMVTIADGVTREGELVSRLAVGASVGRIVRQLVTEGVVQAAVALPIAWLLASAGVTWLVAQAPTRIPGLADVSLDLRALVFASAVVVITGLVVGVAPALLFARRHRPLGGSGRRDTARGAARAQRVLVAVEVALALVLLVGCGLLGHSLAKLSGVDVGFEPRGLSIVRFAGTTGFWRDSARAARFFDAARETAAALTGVTAATIASTAPFSPGSGSSSPILVEGADDRGRSTQQLRVDLDYFDVTQTPILNGRPFTAADDLSADPVVIVSASAARRDFASASPLGRRVRWQGQWRTIVGVAGDVRFSRLWAAAMPTIYAPTAQAPGAQVLVVRTAAPVPLAAMLRERLERVDRATVVQAVDAVPSLIADSYAEERYRATLVTVFGLLAMALTGVGVFATATRSIATREREAGIRLALGASAAAIVGAMTRDVSTGVMTGGLLGAGASVLLSRWLAPQLFSVGAYDPVAFAVGAAPLAAAVGAALVLPIRRALRIDPVRALRAE